MSQRTQNGWESKKAYPKSFELVGTLVCLILLPVAIRNEYYVHLLQTMAYTYIVVLGLDFLVGYTGNFSFGHAGFYALGAYTTALLTTKLGLSFWFALPLAPLVAGIAGIGMAIPSMKPKGPFLIMVTAAFGLIIWIITYQWVALTGGPTGISRIPIPSILGSELNSREYFYLCAGLALLLHWGAQNLLCHKWGRTFLSVKMSEVASEAIGINVYWWKVRAFVISAAYAGIGGSLFAHQNHFINSDSFDIYTSVFFILAVIFGGMGTHYGPLVGTVVLSVLPQLFAPIYDYFFLIYGAILLGCVVFLPKGVVGALQELPYFKGGRKGPPAPVMPFRSPPKGSVPLTREPLLETKRLEISFGGLKAINGLDMSIRRGAIHGLIGPNGSGKSTFINLVSGIYRPDAGEIIYTSEKANSSSPHEFALEGITRTFQTVQLFGHLSALENVMLGFHTQMKCGFTSHYLGTKRARREEQEFKLKALETLNFVGLQDKAFEEAGNLSYGQQKLLEIARALATKPALLFLDEPAGGLSPGEIQDLRKIIQEIRLFGITILLVEHRMDLVMEVCDIITVLDFGTKIAEGKPEAIQKNQEVIKAYLG